MRGASIRQGASNMENIADIWYTDGCVVDSGISYTLVQEIQQWSHWPLGDVVVILNEHILVIYILSTSCEVALGWMPWVPNDEKSTLVPAMAWCCQAPRGLSQYKDVILPV